MRWQRPGFKAYWTWLPRHRNRPGKKCVSRGLRELIFRMVAEDGTCRAPKIHDELWKMLGFKISEQAVNLCESFPEDVTGQIALLFTAKGHAAMIQVSGMLPSGAGMVSAQPLHRMAMSRLLAAGGSPKSGVPRTEREPKTSFSKEPNGKPHLALQSLKEQRVAPFEQGWLNARRMYCAVSVKSAKISAALTFVIRRA